MSLSCSCEVDGAEWYYESQEDFRVLQTKRSRKCCSCNSKIEVGQDSLRFHRYRDPSDRCDYIEESIYGDQVPLASWYMCETCGGLYFAVQDLNMCCDISENIAQQIKQYRATEEYYKRRNTLTP
jgi:hypothetical protein